MAEPKVEPAARLNAALPAPPPAAEAPVIVPVAARAMPPATRPLLMGVDRASAVTALGQPRLSRRDGTAEVLTFTGATCSLFVFLYDGPNGKATVRHVEARARQGFTPVAEGACVDSVLSRKATAPADPV